MNTVAAVMTEQCAGPIATIRLAGDGAEKIIGKIFRTTKKKSIVPQIGKIYVGSVISDGKSIDQVTLGCEDTGNFAIHCHGNPIIVSEITSVLNRNGAELIDADEFILKILSEKTSANTIEKEAKAAIAGAKTLQGTKLIVNQTDNGLSRKVKGWILNLNDFEQEAIKLETGDILKKSKIANFIINGCKIVLFGPPNSGKSTLLNRLAGRQKAIVTDIKGTTRDYVTAQCQLGPLYTDIFDTAGLGKALEADDFAGVFQKKGLELLKEADLVLLILDNSQAELQMDKKFIKNLDEKRTIIVLNKSDLPDRLDVEKIPFDAKNLVKISAKTGSGLENLLEIILKVLKVSDFDTKEAVCFTGRQQEILNKIIEANSKLILKSLFEELLNGKLSV